MAFPPRSIAPNRMPPKTSPFKHLTRSYIVDLQISQIKRVASFKSSRRKDWFKSTCTVRNRASFSGLERGQPNCSLLSSKRMRRADENATAFWTFHSTLLPQTLSTSRIARHARISLLPNPSKMYWRARYLQSRPPMWGKISSEANGSYGVNTWEGWKAFRKYGR